MRKNSFSIKVQLIHCEKNFQIQIKNTVWLWKVYFVVIYYTLVHANWWKFSLYMLYTSAYANSAMTAMIIYNAKLINCRCTHIAVRICHQIRFVYGNPKFHLKTESERGQKWERRYISKNYRILKLIIKLIKLLKKFLKIIIKLLLDIIFFLFSLLLFSFSSLYIKLRTCKFLRNITIKFRFFLSKLYYRRI